VDNLPPLLRSMCEGDIDETLAEYRAIGMELDMEQDMSLDPDQEAALKEFLAWIALPFATETFDFKEHSDYTNKAHEFMHQATEMPVVKKIQEDFIFFERTSYGLFKLFERLEACVNMRDGWDLGEL